MSPEDSSVSYVSATGDLISSNGSTAPSSPNITNSPTTTTNITTHTTQPQNGPPPLSLPHPPTATQTSLHLAIDDDTVHHRLFVDGNSDFSCGISRWHPTFLQRFANKQCFLALFCLTSVLQGVYYTYFVSVLTTIEKLYQIPSKTTGMIMSSTEIGQISGALLLTYYGGQGHRPRWIATGMLVFATAALLCSTPHYLFGSQPTATALETTATSSIIVSLPSPLCTSSSVNSSLDPSTSLDPGSCMESEVIVRRNLVTNSVLALFFISLLLIGLGTTAVNTLGIPYIDDNVASKESPLYFGITIGVRIFGPVCGFLLGSICTSIPVNFPFGSTDLTPTDTNWIGAWWLGLFLVGISLALTSLPMMIFPRRLPTPDPSSYCHQQQQKLLLEHKESLLQELESQKQRSLEAEEASQSTKKTSADLSLQLIDPLGPPPLPNGKNSPTKKSSNASKKKKKLKEETPTLKGFSTALKRLLSNDILLYRTASSVLHILPISGLYTFLPKYLESQFQLTATDANIIAGLAGILVMGFGIFSSGTFMRKYKPSAKFVARWLAFAALAYVLGMVLLMFLGCPTNNYAGFSAEDEQGNDYFYSSSIDQRLDCSQNCACATGKFDPVCLPDGITYISPCVAGCSSFYNSSFEKYYYDCSCSRLPAGLGSSKTAKQESPPLDLVRPGLCPLQCSTLTLYIVIFSITVLIHSTSEVGSMLLTLRCVEPQDKAMALGFISFAIGLFGNVPCPIIYGAVVDSTCLFWEEDDCGKRGACRLYDSTRFRQWFHGITAFIMFLAFAIDVVVCFKAEGIQFHEEPSASEEETKTDPETSATDPARQPFLEEESSKELTSAC